MKQCRALALLGVLLLMAGCDRSATRSGTAATNAEGLTPITVVLDWKPEPEFGGLYAAQLNGAFKRHGLDVTIMAGGPGVPTKQIVLKGEAQFGILAADEVLISRAQGADLVAMFATYQTNPQGIMVHASKGFKTLDDVLSASVTLAVEPGLNYINYLKKQVGDAFKAKLVVYGGSLQPFFGDENFAQQCFVSSEPVTARRKGSDPQVFLIADSGYNPYAALVVTTHSYLDQNGPTVQAMYEALQEGWTDYLKDPTAANEAMHRLNQEMDMPAFQEAARIEEPLVKGDAPGQMGTMSEQRWRTVAQQLVDLGVLKTMPDVSQAFVLLDKIPATHPADQ